MFLMAKLRKTVNRGNILEYLPYAVIKPPAFLSHFHSALHNTFFCKNVYVVQVLAEACETKIMQTVIEKHN